MTEPGWPGDDGRHPGDAGNPPEAGDQGGAADQGGVDPNLFYYPDAPPPGPAEFGQAAQGQATWGQSGPGPVPQPGGFAPQPGGHAQPLGGPVPPGGQGSSGQSPTGAIPAYGSYPGSAQYVAPGQPQPGPHYNPQPTQHYVQPQGYGGPGYGQPQPGYGQPSTGPGMYGLAPQKKNNNTKLIAIIGGAVALIIALVAGFVLVLGGDDEGGEITADGGTGADGGAGSATLPTFPENLPRKYDAACQTSSSGGGEASETELRAGALHLDPTVIPDWTLQSMSRMPGSKFGVGAYRRVVGQPRWVAEVEIGVTKGSDATDAEPGQLAVDMLACLAVSGIFRDDEPDVRNFKATSVKIDGVAAVRVEADLWADRAITELTIDGDHVIMIVIDSAPEAYFSGVYPIGDTGVYRDGVDTAIENLKVDQDM